MHKTFIDFFRNELLSQIEELKDDEEDLHDSLKYLPELVQLLSDLLDNDVLDREYRLMATSALGYFLVPSDVLPEEVYGAYGYMDDMYILCFAISKINEKYPELVTEAWTHEEDFKTVLDECVGSSSSFLDEKNLKEKIMKYCGMLE